MVIKQVKQMNLTIILVTVVGMSPLIAGESYNPHIENV